MSIIDMSMLYHKFYGQNNGNQFSTWENGNAQRQNCSDIYTDARGNRLTKLSTCGKNLRSK